MMMILLLLLWAVQVVAVVGVDADASNHNNLRTTSKLNDDGRSWRNLQKGGGGFDFFGFDFFDEGPEIITSSRQRQSSSSSTTSMSMSITLGPDRQAASWQRMDPKATEYTEARNAQRLSLATLYYSTGGGSEGTGWINEVHECDWYSSANNSEVCNEEGSYISLNLSNNGLVGTLPANDVISEGLQNLNILDLSYNLIGGTIPPSLVSSKMPKLQTLNLSNNSILGGSIPSEIGLATSLSYLILNGNSFNSSIPTQIGNAYNLVDLLLNDNFLTGTIPSQLGNIRGIPPPPSSATNNNINNLTTASTTTTATTTVTVPTPPTTSTSVTRETDGGGGSSSSISITITRADYSNNDGVRRQLQTINATQLDQSSSNATSNTASGSGGLERTMQRLLE